MKILKVGNRFGMLGKHALVQVGETLKLVWLINGRWIVESEGPVCPEVRQQYLSLLF